MEEIIEMMRRAVEVKVQPSRGLTQNTFTISYEGKEPRTVMMVTNKLASLFIEENLRVREFQAESTSEFLSKELQGMEGQLKKKEQEIRDFRERNMGQLPQQLDANLRILERLNQQLQTTNENIRAAEDRSILIQNQIDSLKKRETLLITKGSGKSLVESSEEGSEQATGDPMITQLNNLKRDLANAQSKYTESHPDVIDLKKKIANLESKVEAKMKALREGKAEENSSTPVLNPVAKRLLAQYTEQYSVVVLEIRRLKEEERKLKDQIALYQRRVEDTPKREQELSLFTRDYDLLKSNYQSLLDKKIQAQMAENLERKQQGEQFKILDPARIPEKPFKPDRKKILLMGAFAGLAAGLGLAWLRESLDRSFHTVQDVEVYLGIPVIATIPSLKQESNPRRSASSRAH
jgi:polysaccharide chain length determinant protein (PEP-CTERM system associated)